MFLLLKDKNKRINSYVLVVDKQTVKIIGKLFKLTELMELGVDCLEKLELQRKKLEDKQAVYLLSASPESVNLLLKDFRGQKQCVYDAANVFFTSQLTKQLMEKMAVCPELLARLEVCQLLNLDYVCIDNNTVDLDMQEGLV